MSFRRVRFFSSLWDSISTDFKNYTFSSIIQDCSLVFLFAARVFVLHRLVLLMFYQSFSFGSFLLWTWIRWKKFPWLWSPPSRVILRRKIWGLSSNCNKWTLWCLHIFLININSQLKRWREGSEKTYCWVTVPGQFKGPKKQRLSPSHVLPEPYPLPLPTVNWQHHKRVSSPSEISFLGV